MPITESFADLARLLSARASRRRRFSHRDDPRHTYSIAGDDDGADAATAAHDSSPGARLRSGRLDDAADIPAGL